MREETDRVSYCASFTMVSTVLGLFVASCDGSGEQDHSDAERPTLEMPSQAKSSTTAPSAGAAASNSFAAIPSASAPPVERKSARFAEGLRARPLDEQRAYLVARLVEELGLSGEAQDRIDTIIQASERLSFGHPKASRPAMTKEECRERRAGRSLPESDPRCGRPHMVPVYDPSRESAQDARVCIDQYEFPNLPCEYPVVWARASEAAQLCEAIGKRLCWAHEWEGACAGALLEPEDEYAWSKLPKVYDEPKRQRERRLQMEHLHNEARDVRWAYGEEKAHDRCATTATKSATCTIVDWGLCGTNDFPAGAFPECRSWFGVYDQHGNVAEHMRLPLYPEELNAGPTSGWTEMKGSWFIFAREEAHPDDCRWRAKNWHTTEIAHKSSHANYHLGFRCCRDL